MGSWGESQRRGAAPAGAGLFVRPGTSTPPRLLVLGLDAADADLIERWSADGTLPTFGFLRKSGACVALQPDRPMPSASVWPSIYSGTYAGKHGIYNGLQLESGRQAVCFVNPGHCVQQPFWRYLDRSGKRSIIMDVPFSCPLDDFAGVQIVDWGTYERHYAPHSLPREVLTQISERFGAYPFGAEMSRDAPVRPRHFRRVRAQLINGVAVKGGAIEWLASSRPWDFLMAVFAETHPAGHYFWNFHSDGRIESMHPNFADFRHTIMDVYRAVDNEIARIMSILDETTTLMILSGQGMGPNHANWQLIPEVLNRLGFLAIKSMRARKRGSSANWMAELRELVPLGWRRSVSRHLPAVVRDSLRLHWANSRIDWSKTRAFPLPTDLFGYIRINLKGREPSGIVEPGPEYSALCARITEALHDLVNPRTGRPVVRQVFRTDEFFPGPQRERLPDLIVAWENEPLLDGAYSKEMGTISGESPDLRSGNHQPQGFAIFYGRGIGSHTTSEGRVVDVAPTILSLFGLKSPSAFDGRPLTEVFS
jgi:predicted AlkP superfamily phosphohydrolase/phosphomutase